MKYCKNELGILLLMAHHYEKRRDTFLPDMSVKSLYSLGKTSSTSSNSLENAIEQYLGKSEID